MEQVHPGRLTIRCQWQIRKFSNWSERRRIVSARDWRWSRVRTSPLWPSSIACPPVCTTSTLKAFLTLGKLNSTFCILFNKLQIEKNVKRKDGCHSRQRCWKLALYHLNLPDYSFSSVSKVISMHFGASKWRIS